MAFRIATGLIERIVGEAAASPEVEVCGLLLGRGEAVDEARSCRNVAADPRRAFEIDPAALLAAYRQARAGGPAILGCYHSHPTGKAEPSPRDAAAAEANGWLWLIVAGGEASAWRAVAAGARLARFEVARLTPIHAAGDGGAAIAQESGMPLPVSGPSRPVAADRPGGTP